MGVTIQWKIIKVKDQIEGEKAFFADILKETLQKGAQTLGLATGSSPRAL